MDTVVKTTYGAVRGKVDGNVTAYLGIPFAAPPVGDLRFRAPQPPQPWDDTLDAGRYPKNPMQPAGTAGYSLCSEDCLHLNIWAPRNRTEKALPVMVWICGGGYETGGVGASNAEGTHALYELGLFAEETGCIIVAVNYRINVFGFLNYSFLDARFEDNLGIKDQIAALQWVQQNIAAFGGDAQNVTIFGESAGAGSVSVLLCTPTARPLFHKAIMQSNCFDSIYTKEESEDVARKFLECLGAERPAAILDASYDELYAASQKLNQYVLYRYPARCIYCPVADGELMSEMPTKADLSDVRIPLLLGTNHDEGNLVALTDKRIEDRTVYSRLMLGRVDEEKQDRILAGYRGLPLKKAFGRQLTDMIYTQPLTRFADNYSRHAPAYVYRVDYYPPLLGLMGLNACHVVEVPMLFGTLKMLGGPNLYACAAKQSHAIGKRMRRYWGAFAHTGAPAPEGLPEWPAYDEAQRMTMMFNRKDRPQQDPEAEGRNLYADAACLLA